MTAKFTIEGGEHIQKSLLQLPYIYARRGMQSAFRAGARLVADEAKRLVSVNTGDLKNSIAVVTPKGAMRLGKDSVMVVAIKKHASRRAHLTEYGTQGRVQKKTGRATGASPAKPFLRPALDMQAAQAIKVIAEMSRKNIETIADQLARGQKVSLRRRR